MVPYIRICTRFKFSFVSETSYSFLRQNIGSRRYKNQFFDHFPRLTFLNVSSRTAISPDFALFFQVIQVTWSGKCVLRRKFRGEMNSLHKQKAMSVGYQVKQNLKSRSRKLV